MAIKFIPVKCPECGAALNVEEGRQQIFCSYCGTKILIHNENEYIYHRIDEADIKQAETEAMLRLKEMELEEKENKRMHRRRLLAYVVAAAFVLFGALIVPKNEFGGSMAILVGIIIAGNDFALGMDTKKKRHVITENEAMISAKMRDFCGKSYRSITAVIAPVFQRIILTENEHSSGKCITQSAVRANDCYGFKSVIGRGTGLGVNQMVIPCAVNGEVALIVAACDDCCFTDREGSNI